MRPLEQRLGRAERRAHVAAAPGVGEREDGRLGPADGELLDRRARDRLAARPGRQLLDLGSKVAEVVADRFDEGAAGIPVGRRAEPRELLAYPLRKLLLLHVVGEDVTGLLDGLCERGVELDAVADEREHRGRRRRGEVGLDLLRVRRLPCLDALDDDEPRVAAEQAEGVAGGDRVRTGRLRCAQVLGRLLTDPRPQPLQRQRDLRAVGPRQQIDRLQLALRGHDAKHRRRLRGRPRRAGRRPAER